MTVVTDRRWHSLVLQISRALQPFLNQSPRSISFNYHYVLYQELRVVVGDVVVVDASPVGKEEGLLHQSGYAYWEQLTQHSVV